MTIVPPGFADCSVEIRHSAMARSAFITFGVEPDAVAADQVATKVLVALAGTAGSLINNLDSSTNLIAVTARIGQDGGEPLVYVAESGAVGGKGVTGVPPNCAVLVHKRTARGGRRGRGRLFIPFLIGTSDVAETGILQGSQRTTWQTMCNTILTALTTQGVPMVVLHSASEQGVGAPTTPGLPNKVTSLVVDPLVSTQRRRLGRS